MLWYVRVSHEREKSDFAKLCGDHIIKSMIDWWSMNFDSVSSLSVFFASFFLRSPANFINHITAVCVDIWAKQKNVKGCLTHDKSHRIERPRRWWWSQYLVVGISRAARSGEKSHRRLLCFRFSLSLKLSEDIPGENSGDHPITIKGIDVYLLTRDLPTLHSFSSFFRLIIVVSCCSLVSARLFEEFLVFGWVQVLKRSIFIQPTNMRDLSWHWTWSKVIKSHHHTYPKYFRYLQWNL